MINEFNEQQMFLENEKLIYFTMKKYFPRIYNNLDIRDEYYQIGAIGLLKAIKKYDATKAAFSTYAVPAIWGEIKRTIRDNSSSIHYSRSIIDIANNLIGNYSENYIEDDFESWVIVQINNLDISNHDKIGIQNYLLKPISLENTCDDDEKISFHDMLTSHENTLSDVIYNDYIKNIRKKLNFKEQIIFDKFISGENQTTIGKNIGYSQAQISRIQKKIKMYVIKELYDCEQYELAINTLFESFLHMDELSFINICNQYRINLSICPKNILEKRIKNMQILNQPIYSKKDCNRIILKCMMKLILNDNLPNDNNLIKKSIKNILLKCNIHDVSIVNYLESITKSQIISFINLAKNNINKYNYQNANDITIDESYFKTVKRSVNKSIKQTSETIVDSLILLLECFKKDNLMLRF